MEILFWAEQNVIMNAYFILPNQS